MRKPLKIHSEGCKTIFFLLFFWPLVVLFVIFAWSFRVIEIWKQFVMFSRPGWSPGLLYKQPCHKLINSVIQSVCQPFPPITLRHCHTQMVRDSSNNIGWASALEGLRSTGLPRLFFFYNQGSIFSHEEACIENILWLGSCILELYCICIMTRGGIYGEI